MTSLAEQPFYDSAERMPALRGAFTNLVRYRGLLWLLIQRDVTVRYKRSLLGVSWTVLNPLLTSAILWVIFSAVFRFVIPGGVPYIVYLLSGVLVVTYFQQGVMMTSASLTTSATVLTKVYVPPVVFAFSVACAGAVNFFFGLIPLLVAQLVTGVGIPWTIVLVPVPVAFLLVFIAGVGLFLSVLAIQYNDVHDLTSVGLVLLSYLTPTFYPVSIVPDHYRRFLLLNPIYSFVDVFRHLLWGGTIPPLQSCLIVIGTSLVSLAVGLVVFNRRWANIASLL